MTQVTNWATLTFVTMNLKKLVLKRYPLMHISCITLIFTVNVL